MSPQRRADIALVVLIVAIVLGVAFRAQAHTPTEMDMWFSEWSQTADSGLSHGLLASLDEMMRRHAWYWFEPTSSVSAPTPSAPSYSGSAEQWRSLLSGYWTGAELDFALCVVEGESRGDPGAKNPRSTAAGLWQFLRSTWDTVAAAVGGPSYDSGAPYDPHIATEYAYWLQTTDGWYHWNAAARC